MLDIYTIIPLKAPQSENKLIFVIKLQTVKENDSMKMFFKSYNNQFSFTVLKCQISERQLLMIDDVGVGVTKTLVCWQHQARHSPARTPEHSLACEHHLGLFAISSSAKGVALGAASAPSIPRVALLP